MDQTITFLQKLTALLWGPALITLLFACGVYLTLRLGGIQIRFFWRAIKLTFRGKRADYTVGDITPYQSLTTALAATIGTGNIVGVATALVLGGPGAIVWMWATAILGMATKYAEALLAVHYRDLAPGEAVQGGPMYYIKKGLSTRWHFLAGTFAFLAMFASFGAGNSIQSNAIAEVIRDDFHVNTHITGLVLVVLIGMVIVGGIKSIGAFTQKLIPPLSIIYFLSGIAVLIIQHQQIPALFHLIFSHAFDLHAAGGGIAGFTVATAIRFGVARGVLSNEAGLGTAAMAHAAAKAKHPAEQGLVAMMGPFLDTIIVCTVTALVILMMPNWNQSGLDAAILSANAFSIALGPWAKYYVSAVLILFAFTTLITWSYYGERCAQYLFGPNIRKPFKLLWLVVIFGSASTSLNLVWLISDALNALMAIPNLFALFMLSPMIFRLTSEYITRKMD